MVVGLEMGVGFEIGVGLAFGWAGEVETGVDVVEVSSARGVAIWGVAVAFTGMDVCSVVGAVIAAGDSSVIADGPSSDAREGVASGPAASLGFSVWGGSAEGC